MWASSLSNSLGRMLGRAASINLSASKPLYYLFKGQHVAHQGGLGRPTHYREIQARDQA